MTQSNPTTEIVWEQLGDRLRKFFHARVEPDAVDDLTQEAFLRIHQHIGGLADEERLAGWVFRIARNLVTDHYRRRRRGAVAFDESHESAAASETEESSDYNSEIAAWLPAAIQSLPESQREAVELFELERLPQQEIARRLGLSLTAVKSRVHRGRLALAGIVDRCCAFELDRHGNILDYRRREFSCDCDGHRDRN